ncbi:MAG TPA: hypothetical protein VH518_11055 [Tepidisphaeraceae bacterium]|jgi:hypothetical protein
MRTLTIGLLLTTLGTIQLGCAAGWGDHAQGQSSAAPVASDGKTCVMQAGGTDVLKLTADPKTECKGSDGTMTMTLGEMRVYVWMVGGTVDSAVAGVAGAIKDEFKGFKATSTTPLTIAGSPAVRMVGTGAEADDGDPGTADVIVFKVGDHVFVAGVHGEHLPAAEQQWLLNVVQTAAKP